MPPVRVALLSLALLGGAVASTSPALGHINLLSPVPRVAGIPEGSLSRRPCAQVRDERLDRNVSVFQPGQTIDVVWDAYVQHVSYFRIAFDADGDDSFSARPSMPTDPAADDPTALPAGEGETILAYVQDHTGDLDHVDEQVTLPNVVCDTCTLQLIQFTYGLPIADATYHQCADLVLEGPLAAAADEPAESDVGTPSRADRAGANESGCALDPTRASLTPMASAWVSLAFGAALRRHRRRSLPCPEDHKYMK
jgi:hypothetical protein